MKIMFAPAMLLALVLGCASSAQADETLPQSHLDAASELVDVMNLEENLAAFGDVFIDSMIQQNPDSEPLRDVFSAWFQSIFDWETVRPRYVAMYAESYTEAELREISAFYSTPTGMKSLALMPELAQKGAAIGNELAMEHSQELERMVMERMAEIEKEAMAKP